MSPTIRRAVGVIRCSPDEKNDDKHSPEVQAQSIRAYCDREGWQLLDIYEEIDVSGRWALERRKGLRPAIEAVEAGDADVVIVARFDRMIRSMKVQVEITERVEAKGGDLYAIDSGFITNGNATQKMSAGFLGLVSQYHSDTTRERSAEGVQAAIDAGIPPFGGATAGYKRPVIGVRRNGKPIHGPLAVDETTRDAVVEAWEMRSRAVSISDCRAHLAAHGVHYSYPGVIKLFTSRLVLGELHHGDYRPNLDAHPAIVDRDLWQAVQDARTTRGRQPKSMRLLSRLGVLRCEGCDGRMSIGDDWRGAKVYRCSTSHGACPQRSTIMADTAEQAIWTAALAASEGILGRAYSRADVRAAQAKAEQAEQALAGIVAAFDGLGDIAGTRERILAAQLEAETLRARANRLESAADVSLLVGADDPRVPLERRRGIVTRTIERATVVRAAPGLTGADRITVHPFGE